MAQVSSGRTARVEIYQFPVDCVFVELKEHYKQEPYQASCNTPEDEAYNIQTNTYVLEFSLQEAERILAHPSQLLDEDDEESEICVRPYAPPISRLLVDSRAKDINARFLKKCFKRLEFGDLKDCVPLGDSQRQWIVTFVNDEDAAAVASQRTIQINATMQVDVQLYEQPTRPASLGPQSNPKSHPHDAVDSPPSVSSVNLDLAPPQQSEQVLDHTTSADIGRDVHANSSMSLDICSLPSHITDVPTKYNVSAASLVISEPQHPTHIAVKRLPEEKASDMYQLLTLHLEQFGVDDVQTTTFPQSYDAIKDIFRFDLKVEEIEKLISSEELLFEGDESSALKIEACSTGKIVALRRLDRASQVKITAPLIHKHFGETSPFSATINIICLKPPTVLIEMETYSVASLVVSISEHVLDSKIVLEASFPSAAESQAATDSSTVQFMEQVCAKGDLRVAEPRRDVVLVETDMSQAVLKKFIKSKSNGQLTKSLGNGRYVVTYDNTQDAEKVVEQEVLDYMGTQMKVSFFTPEKETDAMPSLATDNLEYHNEKKDIRLPGDGFHTKSLTYDREFLLKFKDYRNISAFRDVKFPPHLVAKQYVPPKKSKTAARFRPVEWDEPAAANPSAAEPPTADPPAARGSPLKTLLVSNILDFDEQTLYFWIKSSLDVWPKSIQVSASEEEAIVKIPDGAELNSKHHTTANTNFLLHGERLRVTERAPATAIQVICSSTQAGATIEEDTLEAYFSNERYTGVKDSSSLQSVKYKTAYNNLPVYVVTYSNPQDVQSIIDRAPLTRGNWTFHVAEFFKDVGVCGADSLWVYQKDHDSVEDKADGTPLIRIVNVNQELAESETLKLFMSDRKRTNGGTISSMKVQRRSQGFSVDIIYEDPLVAERVYDSYTIDGLKFRETDLELELEIPWLTEDHDDHKVRLSGLTNDVDPEKIKFYLSALSDNVVTEIFFNENQTRAVAMFADSLDYGKLISRHHVIPLKGFTDLGISQEYRCTDLIATGDRLTKEDIELPLENLLYSKFNKDVDVLAEEFPGTTNMWRISTEPEALSHILKEKHLMRQCETLSPHSTFLGLHVSTGGHGKSKEVTSLISDQMILEFVLDMPIGNDMLRKFLQSLGMVLSKDGVITISPQSNRRDNRIALQNWKSLKPSLERFISEKLLIYKTEPLTQQIYDKVSVEMPKLVAGQPLVSGTNAAGQSAGNVIAVGERAAVETLQSQVLQLISRYEAEIEEEISVIDMVIPNILGYQIEYMKLSGFFRNIQQQFMLKSIEGDVTKQSVTIQGVPSKIHSAQKEMLALLLILSNSKACIHRKPIFVKVFSTDSAVAAIRQRLLTNKLVAVWTLENKTISVYSDSNTTSRAALDSICDVVWEVRHPADRDFDDLEMQLLKSTLWKDKKCELQQLYQPLEIVESENLTVLSLAGLTHNKASILEDIPFFFDANVKRTKTFRGNPDKFAFLWRFKSEFFKKQEGDHSVTVDKMKEGDRVTVTGTKDNIANCLRALRTEHDSVCKSEHEVKHQAMIQHINEDTEFLDNVGLRTKCLVVPHREEIISVSDHAVVFPQRGPSSSTRCSLRLPSSKTQCHVQRGDITAMNCDAIVNAANGDLQHVGGLALAIVRNGGESIQQECNDYVRRHGKLMEGQVFTSSAGSLNCKKIIHAVGPKWNYGRTQEERTLYMCIDNCLEEADRLKLQSIAIPPISTGIFAYPLNQAVATIVEAVHDRDKKGETLPQQIIFTDNKEDSLMLFEKELMSRCKKSLPRLSAQRGAPKPQGGQPVIPGGGNYQVNGRNIIVSGRINVEIRHGDVSLSQEDSLVNSIGSNVNLSSGMVAKAIAARAGPQLQAACNTIGQMQACQVEATNAFGLPCRKVLHCVCPQWQGPHTTQALKKVVNRCLKLASSFNHISIAFPALGTGNLRYPEREVAKAMIEAVIDYTENNPNSSLKDVKIVVYHLDKKTQQCFDNELQRLSGVTVPPRNLQPIGMPAPPPSLSATGDAVKGSLTVNNTTISVLQGDITSHKADVLVNSTDRSLNMNGRVSQALLSKAGQAVQNEIGWLAQTPAPDGVWISGAGHLDASHIFHVDGGRVGWLDIIRNCLARCDAHGLSSIAFPALGTGNFGKAPKKMAEIMLKAAVTYIDQNSASGLQRIDIIIFQGDMVEEFVRSMKSCLDQKPSFLARVKVKVVKWAASLLSAASMFQEEIEPEPLPRKYNFNTESMQSSDGSLILDIYGQCEEDIRVCQKELEKKLDKVMDTLLWSSKPTYAEDRENISKLSSTQVEHLRRKASELKVGLEIDQRLHNIKIVGITKSVIAMSEHVVVELKKIERQAQERKEEVLIAKTIQWMYEEADGTWAKFHPSINKGLEDVYNDNTKRMYSYEGNQGNVTLDLNKMKGRNASTTFKIQRNDLSKAQAGVMKLPNAWQAPLDIYREVPLVPATPEYQAVENDFMNTLGAGGTAVLEIQRIQNPTLYQHYVILRKDAAKRLGKPEDQVEKTSLWHGTDEDTVRKIASGKFDRAMSGRNATMYGNGSYFATTSAYSSRYAAPNGQGHKYMMQTKVITGDWCQGSQQLKAAPYKNQAQTEQFDSVVDNMNNPTIFVVFNDASAYPAYIIKFQ